MKHKVVINVTNDEGVRTSVIKGAVRRLPSRIVRWLFGDYTQVYLLKPGESVESVDVREKLKGEW